MQSPYGEQFTHGQAEYGIATYNIAQVKTYDVLVDGATGVERNTRRNSSAGTVTYQFVVESSAAMSDDRVGLRFQDVPDEFDLSIADIWAVPVAGPPLRTPWRNPQ